MSIVNLFRLLPGMRRSLSADDNIDDSVDTSSSDSQVVILLFLFLGLAVGVIMQQLMTRTTSAIVNAVPYSCVMFLIGLGLAGYSQSLEDDEFNASLNEWVRFDADMMLFIFLPPLVFGEAMNLNWHHSKTLFTSALLLAAPGVMLGTVFMGMFIKLLIPYNFSWLLCLLVGAVLASTDTVAVLSIMQQAGASPKLTYLIVGESLLNDGTSMVMFELFLGLLKQPNLKVWPTLGFIASMTLGSVGLGLAIGLCTVRWLRMVNRPLKHIDVESQVAITMIVAYLTFYLAQHVLLISGLLCIVSAAIMLAWLAPPIILNRETMHHIWAFFEWTFNTILFLLSGLIIGHRILVEVNGADWFFMLAIYLLSNLTRFLVVVMLYPLLSQMGHKLERNEAGFVIFGGLRGALGMALGLIIVDNAEDAGISSSDASRCFFYIGGTVALSLLINGSLSQLALNWLDLGSNDSIQSLLIVDQIKRKLRHKMNRMVDKMEKDLNVTPEDMFDVRMSVSILRPSQLEASELLAAMDARREAEENSAHLSQRLADAHARASANGTLDTAVTPSSSAAYSRRGGDEDSDENDEDEDELGSDSDGSSLADESYNQDDGDSWLNPSQIMREKKKQLKKKSKQHQQYNDSADASVDGSVGPYSDSRVLLGAAGSAQMSISSGSSLSTEVSTAGLALQGVGYGGAGGGSGVNSQSQSRTMSNASDIGDKSRQTTVDRGVPGSTKGTGDNYMTASPRGGSLYGKSLTGAVPAHPVDISSGHYHSHHTDAPPLYASGTGSGGGGYDYANDTLEEARRRREKNNDDDIGAGGGLTHRGSFGPFGADDGGRPRTRTWSVGNYLAGSSVREGRASRYSKGSTVGKVQFTEARASRYSTMSTLLDPTRRKGNVVMPEMLAYVRCLFLEIVRMKYWKLIEGGKLPRNCHSSQFLLYSVDVGIEEATYNPSKKRGGQADNYKSMFGSRTTSVASSNPDRENEGLLDWSCIEKDLSKTNIFGRKTMMWWESFMPYWMGRDIASYFLETLEGEHENKQVYMLTAFIEAHEHAQKKIHSFVNVDLDHEALENSGSAGAGGNTWEPTVNSALPDATRARKNTDDTDVIYLRTPEEIQVKNESAHLVAKAKEALEGIEEEVRAEIRAKQAAMTILSKEVELVRELNEEGLLNDTFAERFLEEIQEDREIIDGDQSGMFRRRKGRRQEENMLFGGSVSDGMDMSSPLMDGD